MAETAKNGVALLSELRDPKAVALLRVAKQETGGGCFVALLLRNTQELKQEGKGPPTASTRLKPGESPTKLKPTFGEGGQPHGEPRTFGPPSPQQPPVSTFARPVHRPAPHLWIDLLLTGGGCSPEVVAFLRVAKQPPPVSKKATQARARLAAWGGG